MDNKKEKQKEKEQNKKLKKGGKMYIRDGKVVERKTPMPKLDPALQKILKHTSDVAFIECCRKVVRVVYNDIKIVEFEACMYLVKSKIRRRLIYDAHESFMINIALILSIHRIGKSMRVRFISTKLTAKVSHIHRKSFEARVWKVRGIRPS